MEKDIKTLQDDQQDNIFSSETKFNLQLEVLINSEPGS